ncbi:hypothetical protein Ahy_B08g089649 [Arachis hypogaea]|uniref:SWIM-type domain-containing protein n=1 Tax=Arachis hypogaea TaxID=3818 RepID=A0A444XYH3_ARAHY|nr:hypothetical protein Ahy_B08g089649 [Arachis hypogaea]
MRLGLVFFIKIRTTGWETRNSQWVIVNQTLHYNRDGYHTSHVKAPKRRKTVASTNCKARCYLALDKMTGQWRISRVEVSHSHPLNPKLSGMFSANRQLSMHVKDLIQQNDQAGIRPNETDSKELLKHFSRMKELNPNFFFEIDVDENHSIRNVFWADARCRAAWEYFGDVVTFDTTYKTNRYDMLFGSFVGVNHHGMSTLLGCALLRNEDTHMFADRHMWVPVFFKDEFWAGMRSTQHSESMHSIFDKYLNSKSSLLQFVRQYQNRVIDKEQKEFDSRENIQTPCFETFRINLYDCDISSINHYGTSIVCEVDQQKMCIADTKSCIACSQSSEVQCDCFMFQLNGILCCHSLAVLLHFCVTAMSSQYILSRWSKNVSRRHTYIRSSIVMDRSDKSMTIFTELCSDFYNVTQDFVATPEVAAILCDAMDSARHKLKEHKESEHQAAHVPSAINSHTRDECPVSMDELQGPRRVPTRGRPTSTRFEADLEKSIKKRAHKHKNTHNHNKLNMRSTLFSCHLFILSVLN